MALIIYGVPLSAFVRSLLFVLKTADVNYELIPTLPHSTDPEFQKSSPLGKIPAAKDGDYFVSDSTAIAVYALSKYAPESNLLGSTPEEKGQCVFFEKYEAETMFPICGQYNLHKYALPASGTPGNQESVAFCIEKLPSILEFLERSLNEHSHFVGKNYTIADFAIGTHLFTLVNTQYDISAKYPKILKFLDNFLAQVSVKEVIANERLFVESLKNAGK